MSLTTSVEPLEGNKVRLHVAIPAEDFEQAIDAAFRKLAKEVKLPGFRPGKAPRRLLEARMGSEIARDQALRDSLPEYYADAVVAEAVDVIAPPEIDITAGEEEGDVEFDAVVEVRPQVTVEGHDALRIEIEKPEVGDEAIAQQVDSLRERFADLEDSATPLIDGDYAEIDIKGYIDDESIEGLTATDYLYEVGSGIVVPKLDEELHGKRPGDILKFTDTLPERFGERAGEEVAFQVLVKDTKKKVLPELTDEWVSEVSEFDTVEELQSDVRQRLEMYARVQASMVMREKIFEAAAALVPDDVPETLVNSEMERRLHDLAHRLEEQGIRMTIPQYLAATGQDQQEFVDNVRAGARRGRARRPRAAGGDRPGGDRRDRRGGRGRGRPLGRAGEREAGEGPEGSRTAGGHRGGTLGHRTRQGARVPDGPRGSGRCRRRTRRPLPPAAHRS